MLKEEKKNNKIDGVQTFWWIDGDVFSPATSCPYKFPDQAESSCYGCTVLRKRFTGQKAGTRARESIKNTRFNQLICSFFSLLLSTSLLKIFLVCKRITKIFAKRREMICTPPHDAQIPHMNRAKEEGNNPYTIWKTLLFSCNLLTLHRRFIKLPTACI